MKKLYEFKVEKPIVTKVEEKTDAGTLIKEIEGVEEKKCYIKLPNRCESDQLKVIYSAEFGKALSKGLQTRETMRVAILNSGGFSYADLDLQKIEEVLPVLNQKKNEYLKAELDDLPSEEIKKEVVELQSIVNEMEERLSKVYDHSAETAAERESVLWATANLLFWEDSTPVLPGLTDESRKQKYYDFFDDPNQYVAELQAFSTAFLVLDAFLIKGFSKEEIEEILNTVDSPKESDFIPPIGIS